MLYKSRQKVRYSASYPCLFCYKPFATPKCYGHYQFIERISIVSVIRKPNKLANTNEVTRTFPITKVDLPR